MQKTTSTRLMAAHGICSSAIAIGQHDRTALGKALAAQAHELSSFLRQVPGCDAPAEELLGLAPSIALLRSNAAAIARLDGALGRAVAAGELLHSRLEIAKSAMTAARYARAIDEAASACITLTAASDYAVHVAHVDRAAIAGYAAAMGTLTMTRIRGDRLVELGENVTAVRAAQGALRRLVVAMSGLEMALTGRQAGRPAEDFFTRGLVS